MVCAWSSVGPEAKPSSSLWKDARWSNGSRYSGRSYPFTPASDDGETTATANAGIQGSEHELVHGDPNSEDEHDRRHHQSHVGQLAPRVQELAKPQPQLWADGDQFGCHQRAPGEGPGLLEAGHVARHRRGNDHMAVQGGAPRAHRATDTQQQGRDLVI